jgi:hypothetical protein
MEVILLVVGPQLLDALGTGRLLLANDFGQLCGDLHESLSFRHCEASTDFECLKEKTKKGERLSHFEKPRASIPLV